MKVYLLTYEVFDQFNATVVPCYTIAELRKEWNTFLGFLTPESDYDFEMEIIDYLGDLPRPTFADLAGIYESIYFDYDTFKCMMMMLDLAQEEYKQTPRDGTVKPLSRFEILAED